MKRTACLIALALAGVSCVTEYGMRDSPKREYIVGFEDFNGTVKEARTLVIRRRNETASIFKLPIRRDVKLVWEPAENAVGIIDEFASNENRLIVVGLPKGNTLAEVSRLNIGKWGLDGTNYSHVYIGSLKWERGNLLADVEMYNRLSDSGALDCRGRIQVNALHGSND